MKIRNAYVIVFGSDGRSESIRERADDKLGFTEAISSESGSIPLKQICLLSFEKGFLTHIGLVVREGWSATLMRKIRVKNITHLPHTSYERIIDSLPSFAKKRVKDSLLNGGRIPDKTWMALKEVLIELHPDLEEVIRKLSEPYKIYSGNINEKGLETLALEKEAVGLALSIAEFYRPNYLLNWNASKEKVISSFLGGLEEAKLREDTMIINDLTTMPGWESIGKNQFNTYIFEQDGERLEVLQANRTTIENTLGVDLIYYNPQYKSFVMVQYKVMKKEAAAGESRYRVDSDLNKELNRMKDYKEKIEQLPRTGDSVDFRLNNGPFFLKFCPNVVFQPNKDDLIRGMYIHIDHWETLIKDEKLNGPKGGTVVSFENVERYFCNTQFIYLLQKGWIGTESGGSEFLIEIIKNLLQENHSVILASKAV